VNRKTMFWVFIALIALLSASCSDNNNSGQGQGDATKPLPQVRVVVNPSATASPSAQVENTPSAPEATETVIASDQALTIDPQPTADEDAISNEIEALMDDMDKKLNSEDYTFSK